METRFRPTLAGTACQGRPCAALLLLTVVLTAAPVAAQTVVFGLSARSQFDHNVANYGDTLVNFNTFGVGALTTQLQSALGVSFASTIQTDGSPIANPHEVYVTSTVRGTNNTLKIVGTPFPGGSDDGRVGYDIIFASPQARAGIDRSWMADYSLTRFFNSSGTLLATHANTTGEEFVGYVANYDDPSTWVARMQMDGLSSGGTRQVGYSDNLIFGAAPIPEPPLPLLFATGLGLVWLARRAPAWWRHGPSPDSIRRRSPRPVDPAG